ncbi:hypothetical protein AKJ16_DCAP19362 [Drosera capensis]
MPKLHKRSWMFEDIYEELTWEATEYAIMLRANPHQMWDGLKEEKLLMFQGNDHEEIKEESLLGLQVSDRSRSTIALLHRTTTTSSATMGVSSHLELKPHVPHVQRVHHAP